MTITIARNANLRQVLSERRRELQEDVQSRIRDGRNNNFLEVRDTGEDSDNVHQNDIGFSLLQMRADMLSHIDEALVRLDAGHYGNCLSCEREIAAPRLRALPFAVRCRECEDRREQAKRRVSFLVAGQLGSSEVVSRAGRRSAASY